MHDRARGLRVAAVLFFLFAGVFASAQERQTISMPRGGIRMAAPPRWKVSSRTPTSVEMYIPSDRVRTFRTRPEDKNPKPADQLRSDASMLVVIEPRRNHDEALRRLEEIAAERPEEVRKLLIDGWPAIERTYRAPLPLLGDEVVDQEGNPIALFTTTAIAQGALLVRYEATVMPEADPALIEEALTIARSHRGAERSNRGRSQWEIDHLRVRFTKVELERQPSDGDRIQPGGADVAHPEKGPGVAVTTQSGRGELEIAASNNGQNIVVAANSGFSRSTNFGANWTFGGGTPCNQAACDGDPSLAVGQSGAIYYAWLGGPSSTQIGDGISRSTNNGQTFPFQAMAVNCPGASACTTADQEHIAADRFNAGSGGDRVYNVWRNFTNGPFSIRIVCSSNNGANWGTQLVIGVGDTPRVAVGRDGFVYVAWSSASFGAGNVMLNKYSPCDASNNLTQQVGWPITIASYTNVACPVPGLDRCNGRNILSSPTVAVDDLDASHVYYAFAASTGAGNEDIIIRDSTDGGATFPRSVRVNANVAGRRFMPWVSVYGGVAAVSWYDRRNATVAQNDSTRFFIGTAKPNGPTLTALTETDLSGNNDQQCSTWPCATNNMNDSESCSVQPQLAGRCSISGAPCDFAPNTCPSGQTCNIGRGCPKYGDYNGSAAAAGRFYSAWASAVAPVGTVAPGAGINLYSSMDRIPSDFFVRDWTTNASTHDLGNQPSTNPIFWVSSDVWTQGTNVVQPLVNDWILGDPPSRSAPNFAFARVSRRASAMTTAPAATATVRFAFADFGAGVNFVDLGTETVTFAASDMTRFTPGHSWTVPATASTHLCLVAQISGPDGDAFAPPSVVGLTPGAGAALIMPDNNKAQRNLQDTVGSAGGAAEMFAIIRNDRATRRLVRLRIIVPRQQVDGRVRIVGREPMNLAKSDVLEVGDLAPGEERWMQLRVALPTSESTTTIDFADDVPGGSGFSIRAVAAPGEIAAAANVRMYGEVMLRLAQLEGNELAEREAKDALSIAKERMSYDEYAKYLATHIDIIEKVVMLHLERAQSDPVDVAEALKLLRAATGGKAAEAIAAHNALTERLDAHMTMLVRTKEVK